MKRKILLVFFLLFLLLFEIPDTHAEADTPYEEYLQKAKDNINRKEYGRALENLAQFQKLKPNNPFGFALMGFVYYNQGQYDKAISLYDRAIEIKPNYSRAFLYRGRCHFQIGAKEKTLQDYKRAIELSPDCEPAHFSLGEFYRLSGQYKKAIEHYNEMIRINGKSAHAYNYKGMAERELDMLDQAVGDHSIAIQLKPGWSAPYLYRARAYIRKERYALAIGDLDRALKLDPQNGVTYFYRGLLYEKTGKLNEAIQDYQEFLRLNPRDNEDLKKTVVEKLARIKEENARMRTMGIIFIIYDRKDPAQVRVRNEAVSYIVKIIELNKKNINPQHRPIVNIPIREYFYDNPQHRDYCIKVIGINEEDLPCVGFAGFEQERTGKHLHKITPTVSKITKYSELFRKIEKYVPWIKRFEIDS
ncbi:MAG: tetratricopeptide repeat protein [Candidatus Eremiobacteraeota bacterium]|nr:tetratricopeptide repeat protein [Candidatus Eremiobacteraeota bacterium]